MSQTSPSSKKPFSSAAVHTSNMTKRPQQAQGLIGVAWEKKFGNYLIAEVKTPRHNIA